jgi:phage baseplate assembly protein V
LELRPNELARILTPIRRKLRSLFLRAVVAAIDDAGGRQVLRVELRDAEHGSGVEHFQPYGFASVPLAANAAGAAEALVAQVGGASSHPVALVVDDRRYRPRGQEAGISSLYSVWGRMVACFADGRAEIDGAEVAIGADTTVEIEGGTEVNVAAPAIELDADPGELTLAGRTVRLTSNTTLNIQGPNTTLTSLASILLSSATINITGTAAINITAPEVKINGKKFEDHTHTHGYLDGPTGTVIP